MNDFYWFVSVMVCGRKIGRYDFATELEAEEFKELRTKTLGPIGCYYSVGRRRK